MKPAETSTLFTPVRVGSLMIPNRFVRSATAEFMAEEDGTVTSRLVELYRGLAGGEVGLIISGHAYVRPEGKAGPRQTAVHDDRFVAGLTEVAAAVHAFPSRVFLQLAHAGRQTKPKICGCQPVGPSPVLDPSSGVLPRELSEDEIKALIDAFIQAARRAREAGFDGVELHAAHGYLLSSFISPHTNKRQDGWGGDAERRGRIVVEILRGIKTACGPSFPVIIKLNSTDFLPSGLTLAESVDLAVRLEREGLDAVETSGGMNEAGRGSVWRGLRAEDEEGYFVGNAAEVKRAVRIPVFGLGGLRTFRVMEEAVAAARVDLISLSRPFIRDPDLVRKFRTGGMSKSACISCNKCFNPRGIRCAEVQKARAAGR